MKEELAKLEKEEAELKEKIKNINDDPAIQNSATCYSRVSGYYRPVTRWCIGKKAEFEARKMYKI